MEHDIWLAIDHLKYSLNQVLAALETALFRFKAEFHLSPAVWPCATINLSEPPYLISESPQ